MNYRTINYNNEELITLYESAYEMVSEDEALLNDDLFIAMENEDGVEVENVLAEMVEVFTESERINNYVLVNLDDTELIYNIIIDAFKEYGVEL